MRSNRYSGIAQLLNPVADFADLLDAEPHRIAGFEEFITASADADRRPRENEITWMKCRALLDLFAKLKIMLPVLESCLSTPLT